MFSPIPLLNALAPSERVTTTNDIVYADDPPRRLDVYAPRASAVPAPVVVFFYGGGWASGSRDMYRFIGAELAANGVLAVIPDYRLYPEVRFPVFMQDAADAVAWTYANASRFGGNPHRLFLMGHSAGAHIATLLALDPGYLRAVHLTPQVDVCGVIGLAGPYDLNPLGNATWQAIFRSDAERLRSQPIKYVSAHAPPMLLLSGRDDYTVDPGSTLRLAEQLRGAGTDVEEQLYPMIGHRTLILAMTRPLSFLVPVRQATLGFIAAHQACGR